MVMSKGELVKQAAGTGIAASAAIEKHLAEIRAVAAGAPEERLVSFVCATTGRPFRVRFARAAGVGKFKVAAVEKIGEDARAPGFWDRVFGGSAPQAPPEEAQDLDTSELDLSGWRCAWCDAKDTFVLCTCGSLVCRGKTRRTAEGDDLFVCHDGCGRSGITVRRSFGVQADAQQKSLGETDRQTALPAPRKSLPRPR